MNVALLSACLLSLGLVSAQAEIVNKYNITPEEQAACQVDATTLCGHVFPDQDALIACMRSNAPNLTPLCRKTFLAGLQKRHM